jgi:hypothetical protein
MSGVPIPWIIKMFIAGSFDLLDFLFGWIPLVGELIDGLGILLGVFLWGPMGLIAAWELVALVPLNAVDMWIPTLSLIGMVEMFK